MQGLKQHKNKVSARIINIATLAVALGMAAILVALASSQGLQQEIQKKNKCV